MSLILCPFAHSLLALALVRRKKEAALRDSEEEAVLPKKRGLAAEATLRRQRREAARQRLLVRKREAASLRRREQAIEGALRKRRREAALLEKRGLAIEATRRAHLVAVAAHLKRFGTDLTKVVLKD